MSDTKYASNLKDAIQRAANGIDEKTITDLFYLLGERRKSATYIVNRPNMSHEGMEKHALKTYLDISNQICLLLSIPVTKNNK